VTWWLCGRKTEVEACIMTGNEKNSDLQKLPVCVTEFIKLVIKKMRYRRSVRLEVAAELSSHFEDELKGCATEQEREQKARQLISEFGDAKLLGILLRRAKKRCRPLWRTITARTFQTIGVLILLFCLYTVWFLTGRPTISVDYLSVWNQMSRPQIKDEDNAWPHYEKAVALYTEPNQELNDMHEFTAPGRITLGSLTDDQQQKIKKWVELNESAWQEFVKASSKSYCYREYQYGPNTKDEDKWVFNIILPHLAELRGLARLGRWQARVQIDANQPLQALEDCLSIVRCGSHWQGKGTLVEQLVGLAMSNLGFDEILNIAGTKDLSPVDLKHLQESLLQIYPQSFPLMNVEGERICFLDVVQHLFTEGGPGGGHLVPHKLTYLGDITGSADEVRINMVRLPFYTAAAMVHAGRDETIAKGNEIYGLQINRAKMSPYQRHISDPNGVNDMISKLSKYRFFLIHIIMPAIDRASEIAYRGKVTHQATITILALKQWRLEKNEYPANLDELIAGGYLKELPADPFSDKPLIYKKTDDGFTLYSVGSNFKDDGGESGKDSKGRLTKWRDNGDTVFWPVLEFSKEPED
jgi:competence protein ComGC